MAAGLVLCEGAMPVYAAGTDVILAGLGDFSKPAVSSDASGETKEAAEDAPAADTAAAEEVQAVEEDLFVPDPDAVGTTAFALCDEYLNVRSEADKESAPVGKLYNFGSMEIVDVDENGWYKIRSGNVEGYVAGQYIATGSLAEEIAADAGYTSAEVGVEALHLRASADGDAPVLATISPEHEVEVIEDGGDWVKVVVDGTYGYVSSDYVYTSTEYATAVSLEEEPAAPVSYSETTYEESYDGASDSETSYEESYEEPSYQEYYEEPSYQEYYEEPSYQEYYEEPSYQEYYEEPSYSETSYEEPSYYDTGYEETVSYSYEAQEQADAAAAYTYEAQEQANAAAASTYDAQVLAQEQYQAYLTAQAAADEAAVSMDEQTVLDTAQAASDAYQQYVDAQAAADAAAQAEADALAQAEAAAAAQAEAEAAAAQAEIDAQTYTEENASYDDGSSYEDTYTEDTYYDDGSAYEDTYTDDSSYYEESYEESYEDTSYSGYSSTGQAVADFAVQYVGGPYVYGGSSLTGGADCSGFVMSVYSNFGISLPHNAAAQSGYGTSVSMDNLQPGDLLFYNGDGGIGHVSIYIGGGQVVHASNPTNGIIISDIGYRTPCCATRLV